MRRLALLGMLVLAGCETPEQNAALAQALGNMGQSMTAQAAATRPVRTSCTTMPGAFIGSAPRGLNCTTY